MSELKLDHSSQHVFNIVLINAEENPIAVIDQASFGGNWRWCRAPASWTPGQPLPAKKEKVDALIVFASRYREERILDLCKGIRRVRELESIPLLVAVDQYQMPLANQVREMPNTDFVVTPIEGASLQTNLKRAIDSRA